MKKPKILLLDVETSLMTVTTFSLYNDHLPHTAIVKDWFILSWAWKELGTKSTLAKSVIDFKRKSKEDDYGLVKHIRDTLEDVDVVVGHNLKKFDIKKLNARLIFHRLPPLPPIRLVDTLVEAKKIAKFSSNRLDYLCTHLNGKGKEHTSTRLWERCADGDKAAFKEMVKYNKIDVVRLEELYNILLPYMGAHPHMGAMSGLDRNHSCPKCGSNHFDPGGSKLRYSAAGVPRVQKKCAKCYGYTTFILPKDGK